MKNKIHGISLAVSIFLILSSCNETAKMSIPVEELTSEGYFTLSASNEKGRYGPVIILPERHDSRLIQAEFCWALTILLEDCGINTIALEGMFSEETMTEVQLPFKTEEEKYTALLAILESGEIKAPEFMYLAKGCNVFGIENEAEYAVVLSDDDNAAFFQALLMSIVVDKGFDILESYLQRDDVNIDMILSLNPWTRETFDIITKGHSITEINDRLQELEDKTGNLLNIQARVSLRNVKSFYEAAFTRSVTMASNVYQKLRKNNEALAMIIGAAHTEDITAYFDKNKVSYYVLEPSGLNATDVWSDLSNDEFERKGKGMSVLTDKQIAGFFENSRNTRLTYYKDFAINQFDFTALIGNMIVFSTSPPPRDLSPDILISNGLQIIQESIDINNPKDIKFSVENRKGERLHVRVVENIQGYRFVSLKNVLKDIILRLLQINEQNVSFQQRIQDFEGVIEVFKYMGHEVYFSPNEALFKLDLSQI